MTPQALLAAVLALVQSVEHDAVSGLLSHETYRQAEAVRRALSRTRAPRRVELRVN